MPRIPLFPLNTVLFPGCSLPLRIFEPRYRQMLRTCLDGDRRLGVVLIKSGKEVGGPADPYSIGTVGRIGDIGEPEGGAIPLVVTGERRFRIVSVDRSLPYLVGEVDYLGDDVDPDAPRAAGDLRGVADRYIRLLLAARGEYRGPMELSTDPGAVAVVAASLLSDHPAANRQAILEAEPLSNRLRLMTRAIAASLRAAESAMMRAGPGRNRSVFGIN
ncbi:MAG: LON peptidase substrate-binding domain-containing protein [Chloroflexi bacterium]|nr:LON peptidase substrate-binding domain-containing protein [Chloroflexota bacterium]